MLLFFSYNKNDQEFLVYPYSNKVYYMECTTWCTSNVMACIPQEREACTTSSEHCFFSSHEIQLHQENRKKGKKREKSVDEEDEEVKREKLNKV